MTPIASLGDVVALINIVRGLIKAFDQTKGSAAEFQDIKRRLYAITRVLQEAEKLCTSVESTTELNTSRDDLYTVISQCRGTIERFSKSRAKFEPMLGNDPSRKNPLGVIRKAQWSFTQSGDLAKFHWELELYCSILTALISNVNG